MKSTKKRWNSILWVEACGFSLIIILSWLTEIFRFPHLLFGEAFVPNYERAVLRTVVVLLVWGWVHVVTRRLLKRLHYLEEFLRICGWCRKVCINGEWLTMESYFNSQFSTHTTHGMCPDCVKNTVQEIKQHEKPKAGTADQS